ncbi:MAG: hypothetical protein J0G33_08750 [Afipia felis]|nr:hypothetical protein [Afipia felis]
MPKGRGGESRTEGGAKERRIRKFQPGGEQFRAVLDRVFAQLAAADIPRPGNFNSRTKAPPFFERLGLS